MHDHRPLIFSAAHSTLLQEASRQSRQQPEPSAQPKLLLKRGFYSEGGRAGWGFYFEPAPTPPPEASTSKLANGDANGAAHGGEAAGGAGEDASDARRHGKRRRQARGSRADERPSSPDDLPVSAPTPSCSTRILSHGASSPASLAPPPNKPLPQAVE